MEGEEFGDDVFEGGVGFHFFTTKGHEEARSLMERGWRGLGGFTQIFKNKKGFKIRANPLNLRKSVFYYF